MKTSGANPTRARRGLAAVVAAVVLLGACTSDPGPKRVAQDIVESERETGTITESEAECLLGKLENYSNDELVEIDEGLDKGEGSEDREAAERALTAYELDLSACTN